MFDICIIGAGVIGGLTARELSRFDLRVCLLEAQNDVSCGASRANSGIVHAGFDAYSGSNKARFNLQGARMMERVAGELNVSYERNGSMVVAFDRAQRQTLESLLARGITNGVEGLYIAEGGQARTLEPNLSEEVVAALIAPSGAIICPYSLTIAAVGNAMDNGCELRSNFEVRQIRRSDGYFEISSENETITARTIINAAGLSSSKIAALAGDNSIHITPRRGQYLLYDREAGHLVRHTIFQTPTDAGKGVLISPTADGNLLLGPTSEDLEIPDRSTTADGRALLLETARKTLKTMPTGTITAFSGLRAAGSTGDFIINSPFNGFFNLAGIESPGLSAAPAIAASMPKRLEQAGMTLTPKPDFNPFRASPRITGLSPHEKNTLIAEAPAYGRIICRCENISEGEILAALRQHPRPVSVDGIKRRVRAGMGRCQGGFCLPRVMELLAQELNIPMERIPKDGEGSQILFSRTKEALR